MLTSIFGLVHLLIFLGVIRAGNITPYGRLPIDVSKNNANETADYTFTFWTDTDLKEGDTLNIIFPATEYPNIDIIYGAGAVCQAAVLPDTFTTTTRSLPCNYNSETLAFELTMYTLTSGKFSPHSVVIYGIENPSVIGGTGYFRLETKRNSANLLDYNHIFDLLGFVAQPTNFTSITSSIVANNVVNLNATYTITFTTSVPIPIYGLIVFTFPSTLLVYPDFTCTTSVTASSCSLTAPNVITMTGFSSIIAPGTITVTFNKITNPSISGSPGTLVLQTWTDYIKTILEQSYHTLPSVNPGTLSNASTDMYYTNFGFSGYTLIPNDYIQYEFTFRLLNTIGENGRIDITFPFTIDFCQPTIGFSDLNSLDITTCIMVGAKASVVNAKKISGGTLVTVIVRGTNPGAGTTSSIVIRTYMDYAGTQLIDQLLTGFSLTIQSGFSLMKSLSATIVNNVAERMSAISFTFQPPANVGTTNNGNFEIVFPNKFLTNGTITCRITPAGGSQTTQACTLTGTTLTFIYNTGLDLSSTADNVLLISTSTGGFILPVAGDYYFTFALTQASSSKQRHSIIKTLGPGAIPSLAISPFTGDTDRITLYTFSFLSPAYLDQGNWQSVPTNTQTFFKIKFETLDSTGNMQFRPNLGLNSTTNYTTFPCYGASALVGVSGGQMLSCQLQQSDGFSASTPSIVRVTDFASVQAGIPLILYIPNIQNPASTSNGATITFEIYSIVNHVTTLKYSGKVQLAASVANTVVANFKNTNSGTQGPTNLSPVFSPSTINSISRTQIFLTPGVSRDLNSGDGMILMFPQLPTSTPPFYVWTTDTYCQVGSGTTQVCLVFPEVGWIVISYLAIDMLNSAGQAQISIFSISNPPFAEALDGNLVIYTVKGGREFEKIIYLPFASFTAGSIGNVNVFPNKYEANQVNVEYQWTFVPNDRIMVGGYIQLSFPPNIYNLQTTPAPQATVLEGLFDASTSVAITFTFGINVIKIEGFAEISSGTLVRISVTGVNNPPSNTKTSNFGIASFTPESYSIGYNNLIPGINIIKANPQGVLVYNYFYCTPNNGYIRSNYYLSFYPQTNYPAGTVITIRFPTTEFTVSSFNYSTCSISGALTTMQSCVYSSIGFLVTTDTALEIEAGMDPLIFKFPHIFNFNEELFSGVISVTATYGGIYLDSSGNSDINRKAQTGKKATLLNFTNFTFTPTTESVVANYSVVLQPSASFAASTVIQFEFPYEYPKGLGNVLCFAPDIQISSSISITCTVDEWTVNLTNHNGYSKTALPNGFKVTITGVVNPNIIPSVQTGISVYILTNPNFASQYTYSLGSLAFTKAPNIMDVNALSVSTTYTRMVADYDFTISPTVNITTGYIYIDFPTTYNLQVFSKNPTIKFDSGTASNIYPIYVTIFTPNPAKLAGQSMAIKCTNLGNPNDPGQVFYPRFSILNTALSRITVMSYFNLIRPSPLIFSHNGQIIILNNDEPGELIPGQINAYPLVFPNTTTQTLTIRPNPLSSVIVSQDLVVPIGTKTINIWIGIKSGTLPQTVYVLFDILGDDLNIYWKIRPLQISVYTGQTLISIDSIVSVPSGGRTTPIYINIPKSPLQDLSLLLYQRGTIPTYLNVFPTKVVFNQKELKKPFWVSCGKLCQGSQGSILFLINGTNKASYYMPNRLQSFIITRAPVSKPYILENYVVNVTENSLSVVFSTNVACTIYYIILPAGSLAPTFEDVKNKLVAYDYYSLEYLVGEYIDDSSNYVYSFSITGLQPSTTYFAYFYAEDMNGNTADDEIIYNFTTLSDYPQQVWMKVTGTFNVSADYLNLYNAISTVLNVNVSRFDADTSVLNAKPAGDTKSRNTNFSVYQNRTKYTSTSFTPPSTSGTIITFIIFRDTYNPHTLSNSDLVSAISGSLADISAAFVSSATLDTTYFYNNIVEPDDIRWDIGLTLTPYSTARMISVSGLRLNAAGTIHAAAFKPGARKLYYSTQSPLQTAVRYLQETEDDEHSQMANDIDFLQRNHDEIFYPSGNRFLQTRTNVYCLTSELNELTITCNGADLVGVDYTREDVAGYNTPSYPSSYTLARESDSAGYKADGIARVKTTVAGEEVFLNITSLEADTLYDIYLVATDGNSKYPAPMMDSYIIYLQYRTEPEIPRVISGERLSIVAVLLILIVSLL